MLTESPHPPKLTLYAPRVVHTDADGSLTVEGSLLLSTSVPLSRNRSLHVRHKVKISTLSQPPPELSPPSSFSSSASSFQTSWSSSHTSTSPGGSLENKSRGSFSSTGSTNSWASEGTRVKKRKSGKLKSTVQTSDKVYLPLPIVDNVVPAGDHLVTFRVIVDGSVYPTTSLPGATIFHSIVAKLPPTLQNVGAMAERSITVLPPPLAADTPTTKVTRRVFDDAIQVSIEYKEWVASETTAIITAKRVNPSDRLLDLKTIARVTETVNYRTGENFGKRSWLSGLIPNDPDAATDQPKKPTYVPSPITPEDRLTEQSIGQVVLTPTPLLLPTDVPISLPVRLAGADKVTEPALRVDVHYPRVVTCRHAIDLTFTLQEKVFSKDGSDTGVIKERADNVQVPLVIFGSIKSFESDQRDRSEHSVEHTTPSTSEI